MLLQIAARDIGQLTDIKCMFICKIKLRVHMQVQNAAIGGIDHHRYAVRLYRHAAGGYAARRPTGLLAKQGRGRRAEWFAPVGPEPGPVNRLCGWGVSARGRVARTRQEATRRRT